MKSPGAVACSGLSGGVAVSLSKVLAPVGVNGQWVDMLEVLSPLVSSDMGLAGRLVTEGLQLMGELPDLCVGPRELVSVQEVIREARLSKSELQALLSPNVSQALVRYMAEFLTPIQNLAVAQPGKLVAKESVRDRLDQWVKDANDACLGVSTNRKVDVPRIQDMEFEPNGIVRFPVVCGKLRTFAVPMIELSDHTTRVWAAPEWRPATTE